MVQVSMDDGDDEPLTQVIARTAFGNATIASEVPAITPYDASIHDRPTLPEAIGPQQRAVVLGRRDHRHGRVCH